MDSLKKEFGTKSGLTSDNKMFNKMQRGGSALPSAKSQTNRSAGSRSARTTRTGASRSQRKANPYEDMNVE